MNQPNDTTISSICWNVAASTICWTALYFALIKTKWLKQSPEFYCRILTVTHAVIAVALASWCYWQGPNPYTSPGEINTALQDITLVVSLGYFLYDLGWCLYYQTEPVIMLVHHFASVIAISTVLFERTSGAEAVVGILNLEITNPLLQMRWFLRTAGYNKTVIHTVIELLFIVLFLFLRLVFGTWITYVTTTSNKVKMDVKLCSLSLYLISLAFIFYILRFVKTKYANKKKDASD